MNETPSVTMRAVAERAGVTRQTVSLALRNHPKLPRATCQRIQALAREMGYRPNPLFGALMEHVRDRRQQRGLTTLAFVTAYSTRNEWRTREKLQLDYFAGARVRAHQRGYRLEEFWARESGMTGRRASAILWARNIRGLLLAPLLPARGHLSLDWAHFSVAALGYSVWRPNFHRASSSHFHLVSGAFRQLWKLGYRRITLAVERQFNERADHYYTAALLDCQLRLRRENRVPPFLPFVWNDGAFQNWLERHRPDAIITSQGNLVSRIRSSGLRVPQDVGLVHLSASDAPRGWATMDTKGQVVGATAVDLVIEQLQRNEFGIPQNPQVVMIEPAWIDGTTVRSR